jgi:hypothetical protein
MISLPAAPGHGLAVWTGQGLTQDLIRRVKRWKVNRRANHVVITTHQDQVGRWIGIRAARRRRTGRSHSLPCPAPGPCPITPSRSRTITASWQICWPPQPKCIAAPVPNANGSQPAGGDGRVPGLDRPGASPPRRGRSGSVCHQCRDGQSRLALHGICGRRLACT